MNWLSLVSVATYVRPTEALPSATADAAEAMDRIVEIKRALQERLNTPSAWALYGGWLLAGMSLALVAGTSLAMVARRSRRTPPDLELSRIPDDLRELTRMR